MNFKKSIKLSMLKYKCIQLNLAADIRGQPPPME